MTSIIIPCLILDKEVLKVVKECFKTLKEFTTDYELILVDNGSKLGVSFLKEEADTYIRNEENLGVAKAWNQGLRAARGDYLFVLNDDLILMKNWLEPLIEKLALDETVGIIFPTTKNQGDPFFIQQLAGYCWGMRKEIFANVGEISGDYGIATFEDTDYFMSVKNAGYKLVCLKESKVRHLGRVTYDKLPEAQALYEENENKYLSKFKNFPFLDFE